MPCKGIDTETLHVKECKKAGQWFQRREETKMANVIVIAILVIIAIFAVREAIKHNRGEGGCCGGGGAEKKTKKH